LKQKSGALKNCIGKGEAISHDRLQKLIVDFLYGNQLTFFSITITRKKKKTTQIALIKPVDV
jgi:hypothetical protein